MMNDHTTPFELADLAGELAEARTRGMIWAVLAGAAPDNMAIVSGAGDRTFGELNANANRLARALVARGLEPGDSVALLSSNRPEFAEAFGAVNRAGFRITPINFNLTGGEVAYIVDDCDAKAFLTEPRVAEAARHAAEETGVAVRLAFGGAIDGFESYEDALAAESAEDVDGIAGGFMLYTSGTTGRPKGVARASQSPYPIFQPLTDAAAFRPGRDAMLCTGPVYHAAPLNLNMMLGLNGGVTAVLMDKWDAEETLRLIDRHGVSHTHVVPTMLYRMLNLADAVKEKYDVSSLRWVLHGAAPCPVDVKRRTIDWLGPVLWEYYAATEGGGCIIDSDDWLQRPGSVGQPAPGSSVAIHDDDGHVLPPGEVGTIYLKTPPQNSFVYHKDPEKTAAAHRGGAFTLGDMGRVDGDGYVYLTGRNAETIISGGVNIYPSEVDDVLMLHPAVHDSATVGVPDQEWGEAVRGVVELAPGFAPSDDLAAELIAHCRDRLANFKCPRAIDFADDLPRLPTGKIQRGRVRAPYWEDEIKSI
jgi:long-chain acyl-CoA synthetase